MITRQKIVLVTSRFPLPLVGGFEIKNYHLIKELSKDYDVSAHFIQRSRPRDADILELRKYCRVQIHTPNLLHVALRMMFNWVFGQPLQNALYFSPAANASIKMDLKSADAAMCSVIRTSNYIEDFAGPKLFDLADSLGQLYKQNLPLSKGWRRLAYFVEGSRLLRKEQKIVQNSDGVLFFNQREASLYTDASNVHVVPHGVSEGIFNSSDLERRYSDGLSFIGKLDVAHNVDMVLWFADQILPHLPRNLKLYLIGSTPSPSLLALAKIDARVVILGFLDDPYTVLRSSIASICPLQTGGGIQNKIIESLACGAITIASSKAMGAFNQISDSGILVCDTPIEWVRTINELIDEPQLHQFRRSKGRRYAETKFSWLAYGEAVRNIVKNAIDIRDEK